MDITALSDIGGGHPAQLFTRTPPFPTAPLTCHRGQGQQFVGRASNVLLLTLRTFSSFGPRSSCRRIPACGASIWIPLQAMGAAESQMMTEHERTTLKQRWGDKGEADIVEFVKARMLWP